MCLRAMPWWYPTPPLSPRAVTVVTNGTVWCILGVNFSLRLYPIDVGTVAILVIPSLALFSVPPVHHAQAPARSHPHPRPPTAPIPILHAAAPHRPVPFCTPTPPGSDFESAYVSRKRTTLEVIRAAVRSQVAAASPASLESMRLTPGLRANALTAAARHLGPNPREPNTVFPARARSSTPHIDALRASYTVLGACTPSRSRGRVCYRAGLRVRWQTQSVRDSALPIVRRAGGFLSFLDFGYAPNKFGNRGNVRETEFLDMPASASASVQINVERSKPTVTYISAFRELNLHCQFLGPPGYGRPAFKWRSSDSSF
ncbi:hypothetical protein B0H11DRAFT_2267019 [Mycena galericulata]|nr:hypothetical protein B0H11DRAFT_2267019 [Mycena galericulata]